MGWRPLWEILDPLLENAEPAITITFPHKFLQLDDD